MGLLCAGILERPLSEKLRELYGVSGKGALSVATSVFACILVQAIILLFIGHVLKKIEKMSPLEALFSVYTQGKKKNRSQAVIIGLVVAACMVLTLIPQNLYSTLSSPRFVTYIQRPFLRCKIIVGKSQTLELHRADAGYAVFMIRLNPTPDPQSR